MFVLFGRVQREGSAYRGLVAVDAVVMLVCGIYYVWKRGSEKSFIVCSILFLGAFGAVYQGKMNRIWSAKQYSSSVYSSTYNAEYQRFRTEAFDVEQPYRNVLMQAQAENAVFQRVMGVKYILSSEEVPGYQENSSGIYKNEEVFPVIYGTDQIVSQTEYETYEFPFNQLSFLSHAVVPKEMWQQNAEDIFENVEIEEIPKLFWIKNKQARSFFCSLT